MPEKARGRGHFGDLPIRLCLILWFTHSTRSSSDTTSVLTLVAEPEPFQGEGSRCGLRSNELSVLDKTLVTYPLPSLLRSSHPTSLNNTFGGATSCSLTSSMSQKKGQQKGKAQGSGTSSTEDTSYTDVRDSYVPLFSGQPSDHREWRQRVQLYYRKMTLAKKASEGVLNIVGSFKGVVWRLFEDWPLDRFDKDDAFETMLKILDSNFSYDQRVQLPSDFEGYFNLLQRAPGQTLLTYVNDHEEAYRKLLQHKVSLPESVQGRHLLRRAALTKDQRQLVTLKAPTLEKAAIIEALYLLFGQDYKAGGWNHDRNKRFQRWGNCSRAYAAQDEWWEGEDSGWDDETGYYEVDEQVADYDYDYEEEEFDADAAYYGEDPWPEEPDETGSPERLADEYDTAFASYTDARRRFNELKMARGFLPVVALTDNNQQPVMANASSSSSPSHWQKKGKGKGGKSKGKGKPSATIRYPPQGAGKSDPKGRAKANMTCLRCGQQGHWAANCPQSASKGSGLKRPAPTEGMAQVLEEEQGMIIFEL